MTKEEWQTIAKFGALALIVSFISPRLAYIGVGTIALSIIILKGDEIFQVFGKTATESVRPPVTPS